MILEIVFAAKIQNHSLNKKITNFLTWICHQVLNELTHSTLGDVSIYIIFKHFAVSDI